MGYVKTIVCLANSYKPGGRCIAGREVLSKGKFGGWIRPVSARASEEVSIAESRYEDNVNPNLLDLIEIPLLQPASHNHQTENHIIDTKKRWVKKDEFKWDELKQLRERPDSIWVNRDHTISGLYGCMSETEAATLNHSLMLIKKSQFIVELAKHPWTGKKIFRGKFKYKKTSHNFSITDPRIRDDFARKTFGDYSLEDVYLCISLTKAYPKDNNRCYKLVAAIISDPPF